MREKRNDRNDREVKKEQRKDTRALISGIVAANDKGMSTKRQRDQESMEQVSDSKIYIRHIYRTLTRHICLPFLYVVGIYVFGH